MANKKEDQGMGIADPLNMIIYLMTFGYAGKLPMSSGPTMGGSLASELPSQQFRPEEHYVKSLAPVDTANPAAKGTLQMQKGRDYRG